MKNKRNISYSEWEKEGISRFGENRMAWRFKCPLCGYVAEVRQWVELNAKNDIGQSCVGRFTNPPSKNGFHGKKEGEPCNYAGYGLFKLNPVIIPDAPLVEKDEKDNPKEITGELSVFEWAD